MDKEDIIFLIVATVILAIGIGLPHECAKRIENESVNKADAIYTDKQVINLKTKNEMKEKNETIFKVDTGIGISEVEADHYYKRDGFFIFAKASEEVCVFAADKVVSIHKLPKVETRSECKSM